MSSVEEETLQRFLDAAARGDVNHVTTLLSQVPLIINQRGTNGWNALMMAARNGQYDVVEELLKHGCDKFSVNSSSQTAHDIAKFWGHRHICNLLGGANDVCQRVLPGVDQTPQENYFSRETLERLSEKRTDKSWMEDKERDPRTVYLLFNNLSPMVGVSQRDQGERVETKLCRLKYEDVKNLLNKPTTVLIFLGVEKRKNPLSSSTSSQKEGTSCELPAWFAVGSDEDAGELLKCCSDKCCFLKKDHRELLKLSEDDAGVVAQARSVLAWHSRYSWCPTCGSGTRVEEGGYKRSCLNSECRSQQGVHNTCYPRVDPVVIMLVIHPGGNQCLLGRKKIFPAGMFSCLAGFVEAGECVEEAVRREVEEESGVKVGPVHYVSSQPWPLPSSLMIGCLAVAMTTSITVDENEIEDAQWFPRQQVMDSLLRGDRSKLSLPPRQTIAHQLIKHWINMTSNL
uniref:NAD-capped RNA hydrolase NUDT12 n=2 Tax=Gouania willdenowi TaxID=441366 RepID=A0A8C5DPZ9_GOUWI